MSYYKHIRRNTTEYQQELKEITNPGEMDKANRPFGKEELEKGLHGDWQKEGYAIEKHPADVYEGSSPGFKIVAKDKLGNIVGQAHIVNKPGSKKIWSEGVHVEDSHQRKGLATAMYQHAEKFANKKIRPDKKAQTAEGKALWSQTSTPFGKSEMDKLTKGFADLYELLAKAKSNIIYVATDGDNIGASVERAALSNDIKEIKKQDRLIRKGNNIIRSWVKKRKGTIYIDGGDDISFTLHKKYLPELESMRKDYHDATGYTLTVGVGKSISEAAHAMVYGKLKGKNQIKEWEEEVEEVVSQHVETPEEKYQKEGLLTQKTGK